MNEIFDFSDYQEIANIIKGKIDVEPKIGIILGSGLGSVADAVENPVTIPYDTLPYFPVSTVIGHSGRFVIGTLEGKPILVMQGRTHFYEGYSMQKVTLPVRVMQLLGIEIVILTNAAGGINETFTPGDIMLLTDHLNLLGMAGVNPLRGPNLDEVGPRFPDMSQVYDREIAKIVRKSAADVDIDLKEGIYVCLAGPTFETPADLRFLKAVGVDAVGMSTVPEAIVARHGGQRVIGFSGITNKSNLDGSASTTHEEVIEAGKVIGPKMARLLRAVVRNL